MKLPKHLEEVSPSIRDAQRMENARAQARRLLEECQVTREELLRIPRRMPMTQDQIDEFYARNW